MAKVQLEAVLRLVDVQINPQVFRRISQAVAGMPAALSQTNRQLQAAAGNAGQLNNRLRQTNQTLTQNERAARLFLQRMAQFAILLPTFATLNRAIQGSVKFLFEFDSALRDIVRTDVSGLAHRMEEIGESALKTAVDFGVLAQEVLETVKVFVQAGLSIEDAQERARLAILATQVSTLSSADAVEFFLSAANQFKLTNEQLTGSLDALVKVEDLAAVEAQDIAEAFRTGGNSMAEFGKDINDAIGLISALREQTRKSGREIGTFFKTLQTRIFAAGESRDALEALGVTVENLDGSLRPTLDVLNDLKKAFEGLTEAQTANAAKAIGGVRQFESLIATLNSLDRANELSKEASKAAGTADLKRTITDEKLERQLGKLIAQGQMFAEALGDAGLEDALAGALNVATKLLSLFTSLVDAVGDLGGNLTPLLALAGIKIGGSVLGLAGAGAAGGGPKGAAPGQANFIGPLTKSQAAISSFTTDLNRLGSITVNTGQLLGKYAMQVGTNLTVSQAQGIQQNINAQSLKVHTTAIATNAKAFAASTASAIQQKVANLNSATAMVAVTLAATFLPKVFAALEEKALSLGGGLGLASSTLVGIVGTGASMAAQFAVLGKEAAKTAGAFGLVFEGARQFVNAIKEQEAALEEQSNLSLSQGRISASEFRLQGGGSQGAQAQTDILKNLIANVKDAEIGKELAAAIQKSLEETITGQGFKDLKISSEELRQSLFGNISVLKTLISSNEEYIQAIAEEEGRLDQFNALQQGLADGSLNAGQAFGLLVRSLGAGVAEIDKDTGMLKRALSFEDFQAAQEVIDLADSIRTLGREMEVAKLGPKALSDNLVRLQTEFLITQEASARTQESLREELNAAIINLGDVKAPTNIKFQDLLSDLLNTPETFNDEAVVQFKESIRSLPKAQREAAEEILKIVEKQVQDRLSLTKSENDMLEEQNSRRKAMLESETQATLNAFEASRRFSAELMKFGDAVNTDVLKQFQNVSTQDIDKVLAGSSDLGKGIQQIILGAFGENKPGNQLAKAQTDLAAITDKTQADLDILAKKLELVDNKLVDGEHTNETVALTTEKRSIQLEIEKAKQQGVIDSTEAKIKVLEAERDVAAKAKEEEERRLKAIEKLSDASRAFDNEIRSINQGFKDFMQQKIEDLLGKEADAQQELKDAQQEVLNSTSELSDAYGALIQAQFEFGNVMAEAHLKSNMLEKDIAKLTGAIFSFDGELAAIGDSFNQVLDSANITLAKRIELEQQLAEETLAFLTQAKDQIVQAGIGVFGQTGAENQALGQGIAGLQLIADKLGGSFEAFLNMTQSDFASVSQSLLALPAEFRQQILDALSFLPSTMNIGGFSVEQLTQAIGQVGAGVAPEAGLPSIEELTNQQVEQLSRLQELALQDAQLQYSQVIAAQEQVAVAQEAVDAALVMQQRSEQNLMDVRDAVFEEKAVLDAANQQRLELLNAVIAADDRNTLNMIEKEAQAFADQNAVFREVGDTIVKGIAGAIGAKLAVMEAQTNVNNLAKGYIPNFAGGNLTPDEASGLLSAASREKKQMPAGAGLAIANTSEAIIPMRNKGFVPNFQDGNMSSISAGIAAIKAVNETVVAAIAQSVTEAIAGLSNGGEQTPDLLGEVITQLRNISDTLDGVEESNTQIQTNTTATTPGTTPTTTPTASANSVRIVLETNQNNTITITGLEDLHNQIVLAVRDAASEQVDEQLASLLAELDSIITALQERGLLSSFGQPR